MQEKVTERFKSIMDGYGYEPMNRRTPDVRFEEDLGLDSLDAIELLMSAEEEFDIDIPDHEAEKIKTIGEAEAFIKAAPARTA